MASSSSGRPPPNEPPPVPFKFSAPAKRKPPGDDKASRKRPSLAGSFARRIAFLVEQLGQASQTPNSNGNGQSLISHRNVEGIIAQLKKTDQSLKRKPEKQLREAVEAALGLGVEAANGGAHDIESEDSEAEFDVASGDPGFMNRSLLGMYGRTGSQSNTENGDESGDVEVDGDAAKDGSHVLEVDGEAEKARETTSEVPRPVPAGSAPGQTPAETATPKRPAGAAPREPKRTKTAGSTAGKNKAALAVKYPPPQSRLRDMGGIDALVPEILRVILLPFAHSEIHVHLGITPPRGVLLHGPPGCGKTLLAGAIAGELGVPFISISAPSVVGGMSGESEKRIREIFDEAKELAPAILFFDEIDVICPKRENAQREMERRMVAQFLTCMDELAEAGGHVMVLGATNRPDSLDPALRRAGRFDREMALSIPDESGRRKILGVLCGKMRLSEEGVSMLDRLAKVTPGYVGADLVSLCSEAGSEAIGRIYRDVLGNGSAMDLDTVAASLPAAGVDGEPPHAADLVDAFLRSHPEPLATEEMQPLAVTEDDFMKAVKKVQPSSKREGFATVPDTSWDDIGALAGVREELRMSVVEPIRHPDLFKSVGIVAPMGVLMYGPPGCGKTLLAKAVANESHSNFLSVKGPELLNKYVGESERAIRQVFQRARASAPCIIFFDELDALAPTRSNEGDSQSSARLVNTLLTELDGMSSRGGVFVIAATNRPDIIDPAMLRPGRLDRVLYVDLPTLPERAEILKTVTRMTPLEPDVDVGKLAADPRCDGFSGADLSSLVREAAMNALRAEFPDLTTGGERHSAPLTVGNRHFDVAFTKVAPSVSKKDYKIYKALSKRLSGRSRLTEAAAEDVAVEVAQEVPQ